MTLTPLHVHEPERDGYQIHEWSEHIANGPDYDLTVTVSTAVHPVTDHVDGPVVIISNPSNIDEIRDRSQLDALIVALINARDVWTDLEPTPTVTR
ncbi:hypothetical protein RND64_08850 [Gordonia sp. w5E2]|uniref:Uncharacterized protein n=1 Tax=Gordonia jacobaea TaxID=122202 RepID=A0ABR5IGT9_9ACTN|nr:MULTISPECIES: hypothetical protein [Gordonia]KNA92924.1 hypothetical protein ABW18_00105 [Gordonia jacobaea]